MRSQVGFITKKRKNNMSLWDWFVQMDETDAEILLYLRVSKWHTVKQMVNDKNLMSKVGTSQTLRNRMKLMQQNGYIELELNDEGLQQARLTEKRTLGKPLRCGRECVEDIIFIKKRVEERDNGNLV